MAERKAAAGVAEAGEEEAGTKPAEAGEVTGRSRAPDTPGKADDNAAGTAPVDAAADDADINTPQETHAGKKVTDVREPRRQISVSVRTLLVTLLIAGLLISVGVLSWLYLGAIAKVHDDARQTSDRSHAERIALDYAIGAAKIDFQDLNAWDANLVKGTTPELKEKLNSAAKSMEQILEPLQWNSTATPLAAKVRSESNGIYIVDTFVGVDTKTVQAPDGLRSTATYSITIDSKHDWQISEVGGIGSVIGQK